MATFEEEKQQYQELRKVLDALNAIEPESLGRMNDLGKDLNFEAGLPVFRRTLGLFQDLSACNLDNFPYETLQQLHSKADEVLSYFQRIQNFSITQQSQNPVQARDTLIEQLRNQWQSYYSAITPHISYAIRRGTDFDSLEREARGTLALQKQLAEDFRKEKNEILGEMGQALTQVRRAAAEAGVAQHAIHFKEEAEFHKWQSVYWLITAIVFAAATIVYAHWSLGSQPNDLSAVTVPRVIQLVVPHLVVIFVVTFGLVWSVRNFAASRHNFVVNRHRQNALSSFETFVKGTSDPNTKDAVLLQATQSIFAPQESGFLKNENTPHPGSQIVEVIRGVTGGNS
jgi:hypothetical protein